MFRVRTFGGLSVIEEGADGAPIAVQRRRLALLALLAGAGDRGMTRERIMAYLWPESGTTSARHNLKQAVFGLRQQFGADVFAGEIALRLNANVMRTDRAELERALAEDRIDDAMALRVGPFLDGFHLDGAVEFERWMDAEREGISQQLQRALEAHAMRAEEKRDAQSSVRRWRQLVALDPYSSRYTVGLMRSLASAGDTPGAIRVARAHETRVREELDVAVDPVVVGWVERLRGIKTEK
ncbi:MAG TPA: BTAD domain-containing putative transcriptional regulator [Gemmatimonadaceae bacterium]|nr:BTAD domain-containing putative transcriptional regulator [Gemmatimonadaceae bacterium]